MTRVTISRNYQVVLPKEVRDALDLKPGQGMSILAVDRRIEMIPIRPARKSRGFLKGLDATTVEREKNRL